MKFNIEHEQEEDGRWLAVIPELPGVLAYGATAEEAMAKAKACPSRIRVWVTVRLVPSTLAYRFQHARDSLPFLAKAARVQGRWAARQRHLGRIHIGGTNETR